MRNRVKDLAVILGTAALTALIAALLLAPETTVAEDDAFLATLAGASRALEAEGLTLTLDAGERIHAPGEKPVLRLKAVSGAENQVCVGVDVELTSMRQPSPMSRSMPIPRVVWSGRVEAKLAPGESREIEIATGFETAADSVVGVNLAVGKKRVRAGGFSVRSAEPAAEPPAEITVQARSR